MPHPASTVEATTVMSLKMSSFFSSSGATSEEEEDFFESLDSLKQASASLDLHESGSCSLLLPCGLLPEELAELEGGPIASALKVEARITVARIPLEDSSGAEEPAAPNTPMGAEARLPATGPAKRPLPSVKGRDVEVGAGPAGVAGLRGVESAARPAAALPVESAAAS